MLHPIGGVVSDEPEATAIDSWAALPDRWVPLVDRTETSSGTLS